MFDSPAAAVIAVVTIDFVGALPTMRHSWLKPNEETWLTFAISGTGGVLAIFALSSYNWTSLTYAAYIVLANFSITTIIVHRRRRLNLQ